MNKWIGLRKRQLSKPEDGARREFRQSGNITSVATQVQSLKSQSFIDNVWRCTRS